MTSTSVRSVAETLQRPSCVDDLHWLRDNVPFRTAQDYAATEYLYRLRLRSLYLRSRLLSNRDVEPELFLQYPVQVTGQLFYMGEPLSPVVESSAVYAAAASPLPSVEEEHGKKEKAPVSAATCTFVDEWLIFSLELCDVPLDAVCVLRLWHRERAVAATTFHVYAVEGQLRVGPQHLVLHHCDCGQQQLDSVISAPIDTTLDLLDDYYRGRVPVIPWLDALSLQQVTARRAVNAMARICSQPSASDDNDQAEAVLTIHLPTATTAVFFEPSEEPGSAAAAGMYARVPFPDEHTFSKEHNLCEAMAAITAKSQYFLSESSAPPGPRERHQLASLLRRPPLQLDSGGAGSGARLEETRLLWSYRHFICRDGKFFLPFMRSVDWANTHSVERRAAAALLRQWARPALADVLACLSFYFDRVAPVRQYAVHLLAKEGDGRLCQLAFQLLQAVRYDSTEGELAGLLLDRVTASWELCSTVYTMLTVEVTLERRRSSGKVAAVANDRQPSPQLQQRRSVTDAVFEPLMRRMADRLARQCPLYVARLRQQHAMHHILQQLSGQVQQSALDRLGKAALGNKLIAKESCGLHALFYSLRQRAASRSKASQQPQQVLHAGHADSVSHNNSLTTAPSSGQLERTVRRSPSSTDGEEDNENDNSSDGEGPTPPRSPHPRSTASVATMVELLDSYGVVTLPTHPAIPITGIEPNSLYIFKSTKMPMRLTFKAHWPAEPHPVLPTRPSHRNPHDRLSSSGSPTTPASVLLTPLAMQRSARAQRGCAWDGPSSRLFATPATATAALMEEDPIRSMEAETVPLAMMYKYDDDVRQDQLIVQLIRVMDDLLQQDGLQLYLTPYRVIATGPQEGLVEIVPQVTTFFSVQREVLKYLRVYNPSAELLRQAMDRYTRSFAGYSVITFVLGIGDRHLENILLTQDGRLLHIDFGYVLGNDPKPFPPPMKISREMVEVLGGPQSAGFTEFKLYCCSAYNTLRKHAALLLHMLLLGAHAEGMPQVTGEGGDPRVMLLKVQEKLRLDLTNAQATQYLQNVIADSVGSIFTNLWDVLHAAAQATRS